MDTGRPRSEESLRAEIEELRRRLREAEDAVETLRAKPDDQISHGNNLFPDEITPHKQAEEALAERNEQFTALLANLSSGVALVDEHGEFVLCNESFLRIFGLSSEIDSVNSQDWSRWQTFSEQGGLLHVDDHPVRKAAFSGKAVQNQLVRVKRPCDGEELWLLVSAVPILKPSGRLHQMICTYHDITHRKRAEEALRQSDERLRLAVQAARMATWDWDILTGLASWNDEHYRMLEYRPQDVRPGYEAWAQRVHPEDRDKTEALHRKAMEQGGDYLAEFRILPPDGTERWLEARGKFERNAAGQAVRSYGMMIDFTQRKRAEMALEQREKDLEEAQRIAHIGSWFWDAKTDATIGSHELLRIYGFDPRSQAMPDFKEQRGRCYPVEYWEQINAAVQKTLETGIGYEFDVQAIRNGERIWVTLRCEAVWDATGQVSGLRGTVQDITERKNIEEQIRHINEQLESAVLERTRELQATVASLEAEIRIRQRLEFEILQISEREQCRLGQDLHDGLGQELAGIAMLMGVHAKQLEEQAHPLATKSGQIAANVRMAIESARRIAKGLYPVELERSGLLIALKDLAAQTSQLTHIRCELRQYGADPRLERSAEIHLYRIVQECISNAIKHGGPSNIVIESLAGDASHSFTVTDDGAGFDESSVVHGMGLNLIKYRSRMIGAQIAIEQPAEGGCRVTCSLKN